MNFKTYDEAFTALARMSGEARKLWERHDAGDPGVTYDMAKAATKRVQVMSKQVIGFKGFADDPVTVTF